MSKGKELKNRLLDAVMPICCLYLFLPLAYLPLYEILPEMGIRTYVYIRIPLWILLLAGYIYLSMYLTAKLPKKYWVGVIVPAVLMIMFFHKNVELRDKIKVNELYHFLPAKFEERVLMKKFMDEGKYGEALRVLVPVDVKTKDR